MCFHWGHEISWIDQITARPKVSKNIAMEDVEQKLIDTEKIRLLLSRRIRMRFWSCFCLLWSQCNKLNNKSCNSWWILKWTRPKEHITATEPAVEDLVHEVMPSTNSNNRSTAEGDLQAQQKSQCHLWLDLRLNQCWIRKRRRYLH